MVQIQGVHFHREKRIKCLQGLLTEGTENVGRNIGIIIIVVVVIVVVVIIIIIIVSAIVMFFLLDREGLSHRNFLLVDCQNNKTSCPLLCCRS